MQNDRTSKNTEQDQFDKLIRSKLEGHYVPVSANNWSQIEAQIKNKKVINYWWYIGAAAIVIGLLMLSVNPLNNSNLNSEDMAEITTPYTPHNPDKVDKTEEKSDAIITANNELTSEKHTIVVDRKKKKEVPLSTEKTTEDPQNIQESVISVADAKKEEKQNIAEKNAKEKKENKSYKSEPYKEDHPLFKDASHVTTKSSAKDMSFALAVSTGGKSFDMTNNDYYNDHSFDFNSPNFGNAPPGSTEISREEWDVNYKLPISVGLILRKKLNNRFALESGLVYTYLYSDVKKRNYNFQGESIFTQEGNIRLHYLGIPANIIINIQDNPNWNIYALSGVMLDKGISMKQKLSGYRAEEVSTKTWVHGSQWSAHAAVGISYKITPTWGLYFEPRISYYFDNKQPVSIRTEKQTIFNFTAGVKFNLD